MNELKTGLLEFPWPMFASPTMLYLSMKSGISGLYLIEELFPKGPKSNVHSSEKIVISE